MTTGKLRTVIKILLLFALAAIPESKVREEAKPQEVSTMVIKNKKRSPIGFFKKSINNKKPVSERKEQRIKL